MAGHRLEVTPALLFDPGDLGNRTTRSSPNKPQNMFPFTKADIWPNIGFKVTAGESGTSLLKAAFASSLGLGIFIDPGAIMIPPPALRLTIQALTLSPASHSVCVSRHASER
ncbi:MAG: hypothetical protein ACREOM_03000 [Candidatus Dormibacteraceae bacterium]